MASFSQIGQSLVILSQLCINVGYFELVKEPKNVGKSRFCTKPSLMDLGTTSKAWQLAITACISALWANMADLARHVPTRCDQIKLKNKV